jgi:hypothetical protein
VKNSDHTKEITKEVTNEITRERRKRKRSSLSLLFCGCHQGGRGEEQGFLNLGAQLLGLHSPLLFSVSPLPELPL